jgi:SAM-dependent methyltransferase
MNLELESTDCNLCGQDDYDFYFGQVDRRFSNTPREHFTLVECKKCGLIYLNPRPKPDSIGLFYTDAFYDQRAQENRSKSLSSRLIRFIDIHRFIEERALGEKTAIVRRIKPKAGRLLDIGCASGDYLSKMKGLGWEVFGVDISEKMIDFIVNKRGVNGACGDFLGIAELAENHYDAITFWASLEHLYDPVGAIKKANLLLKNGGIIVILVPNANSWEEKYLKKIDANPIDIPRHLYHFREETLAKILTINGFAILSAKHFTLNGADRISVIIDKIVAKIPPSNRLLKFARLVLFNASCAAGLMVSCISSISKRSHSMVIVGIK